jgi:hypothetical protein
MPFDDILVTASQGSLSRRHSTKSPLGTVNAWYSTAFPAFVTPIVEINDVEY